MHQPKRKRPGATVAFLAELSRPPTSALELPDVQLFAGRHFWSLAAGSTCLASHLTMFVSGHRGNVRGRAESSRAAFSAACQSNVYMLDRTATSVNDRTSLTTKVP